MAFLTRRLLLAGGNFTDEIVSCSMKTRFCMFGNKNTSDSGDENKNHRNLRGIVSLDDDLIHFL